MASCATWAYLHNCETPETIRDKRYQAHIDRAPVFLRNDAAILADFIRQHIHYGDDSDLLYRIDKGRIRPSKSLADQLASLISGNPEFIMIDDQKMVYETAIDIAVRTQGRTNGKHVYIVQGGPGTGKSVVAVNLLVELTKRSLNARYITKNAAPRAVYEAKLAGRMSKSRISNMFTGSGSFHSTPSNTFDALLVDEAHRLNEKSGMFQNIGENQVKEIIGSSRLSVFFIDEDQQVTWKDIGSVKEIEQWAQYHGATIHRSELASQFRCNGSDGYLNWATNALQIRETANTILNQHENEYDFRVCENPSQLLALLKQRNANNKARMVAGYCWPWASKNDSSAMDIQFPEHGFAMQWNFANDGGLWILKPASIDQIGCIHTCQGLELDYVGVIIGPDLIVRDGTVITDATERAHSDSSIKGFKAASKIDRVQARERADAIIKNTYRTLMTRGQKGCYIWCTDPETNAYFQSMMREFKEDSATTSRIQTRYPTAESDDATEGDNTIPFTIIPDSDVIPFTNALPIFSLKASAGALSEEQEHNISCWVEPPQGFHIDASCFLLQVTGESMNRRIPNGSWCLWRRITGGSREGRIVLAEYRHLGDGEHAGHYTVKRYHSEKRFTSADDWQHRTVCLQPDSDDPRYQDIVIPAEQANDFRIIAELIAVVPM